MPPHVLLLYCLLAWRCRPGNTLYLDGEGGPQSGGGTVNNMCFPSEVAPSYAPPGQVCVLVGDLL